MLFMSFWLGIREGFGWVFFMILQLDVIGLWLFESVNGFNI